MEGNISDAEVFTAMLDDYMLVVEHITRERVEPRLKEISLSAEYRWDVDTSTEFLLDHPLASFSNGERAAILSFLTAVRSVPPMAPELDDRAWAEGQRLGRQLLPMLRRHRQLRADQASA